MDRPAKKGRGDGANVYQPRMRKAAKAKERPALQVLMPDEEKEVLRAYSDKFGISMSECVRWAVSYVIAHKLDPSPREV